MFRNREEIRRIMMELAEKFRKKGAVSPEKAMTAQELGLPPRFEQAMHRRLGQLKIFVQVNGKYYLDEERLRQIREQRVKAGSGSIRKGGWKRAGTAGWSCYIGILLILPIGLIIALGLFYFLTISGFGFFPGEFLAILAVVLVVMAIARILFWRSRRRYRLEQWGGNPR